MFFSPQLIVSPRHASQAVVAATYHTGDRTASITVTMSAGLKDLGAGAASDLVDGFIGLGDPQNTWFTNNFSTAGAFVRFQFSSAVTVVEAKWYQEAASTHGSWIWQGSNDGSSFTNIGSAFALGGVAGAQVQTQLNGNTTAYLYYQLLIQSGSTSSTPYLQEIEFKY